MARDGEHFFFFFLFFFGYLDQEAHLSKGVDGNLIRQVGG
jgi:hypothetical protein